MKRLSLILLLVFCLSLATPAAAQEGLPPPDPNGLWSEVVDQNGNIRYDNMIDLGVTTETPAWMAVDLPFDSTLQLEASYHSYQTPSGNIVVMPSPLTLVFMALNPSESGLYGANSQMGSGVGALLEAPALLQALTAGYIDPSDFNYSNPDQFFADVINGDLSLWTVLGENVFNFLWSLSSTSIEDGTLYTLLLLYVAGNCDQIPGGCPDLVELPEPPPIPDSCTTPVIQKGAITVTARLLYPPYPVVVGQDSAKRGADLIWEVRVEPTNFTYGVWVPVYEQVCLEWHAGDPPRDCKTSDSMWYNDGFTETRLVRHNCEKRTEIFPESLHRVTLSASLDKASRDWILVGDLQIRYPGAYLHNPVFTFAGNPATGGFQGNTFVWTFTRNGVQLADPGVFDLIVSGATSGTPVSQWRGFERAGGYAQVWLVQTVIVK